MIRQTTYSVETIRSGQPRPYADTIREYPITVKATKFDIDGLHPWLLHGDVESRIRREEADRAAGRMHGGQSPDSLRKAQRDWARSIVMTLCQKFREKDDDDGRTGMEAYFYPTLQSMKLDPTAGTIHVVIIEPYTD